MERILTKDKFIIQAYHGDTLTGVAILNFLKNRDHIMDEVQEFWVVDINNCANDGHNLFPPTIEELDMVLNLHRELFKAQDSVYAHLQLIKPTLEDKMETRRRILTMKRLWLEMDL